MFDTSDADWAGSFTGREQQHHRLRSFDTSTDSCSQLRDEIPPNDAPRHETQQNVTRALPSLDLLGRMSLGRDSKGLSFGDPRCATGDRCDAMRCHV